jgi:NRAMP (natural resistance-associated macrophage protein)-like metal ion transporter
MIRRIAIFFKKLAKSPRVAKILMFLAIMGPGIITANVDNDANGIATYSVAGAEYGYSILWVLFVVMFFQAVVQEMCSRLGAVTGKGLSDLIRENFGVRITMYLMLVLLAANFANVIGNFAGLAAAAELMFGVPRFVSVPLGAFLAWFLVVKGTYEKVEKIFLWACLIYVTYIISGLLAKPDWGDVGRQIVMPSVKPDLPYIYMVIAIVGTTIAPWMQFFQQSAVRDKHVPLKDYAFVRWDTYVGTIIMAFVTSFIIIACAATLHVKGLKVETAEQAALALAPLAGKYASLLFGIGLLNAAVFATSIIPISTAYSICEAFGWESGIGKSFKEAPVFLGIYTFLIVAGAFVILIPGIPLIPIMVMSQALNGILLPFILIMILVLVNNRKLMGNFVNSRIFNFLAWFTVVIVSILSIILVVMGFMPAKGS